MKFTDVKNNLTKKAHKGSFALKKASPDILFGFSVIGFGATVYLASKETLKAQDIIKEHKEMIAQATEVMESDEYKEVRDSGEFTEADYKRDVTITCVKTGKKMVVNYMPAIVAGAVSLSCMFGSHQILRNRGIALAAAYTAVDKSFKEYRKRTVEKVGAEVEKGIRYGLKSVEIEEKVTDEKGKEKIEKKEVSVMDHNHSPYAKFFDSSSSYWEKDPEYNMMFLHQVMQHENDKLKAKGRLFLNEVYRDLGLEETKAGQVVGWVYDEENPIGDNFVDFHIFETNVANREFVNGYEPVILLDFNVDGNIWDTM